MRLKLFMRRLFDADTNGLKPGLRAISKSLCHGLELDTVHLDLWRPARERDLTRLPGPDRIRGNPSWPTVWRRVNSWCSLPSNPPSVSTDDKPRFPASSGNS